MALLPVVPRQASDEHEKVARNGLVQEPLVHGPELLPDVILVVPIQSRRAGQIPSCLSSSRATIIAMRGFDRRSDVLAAVGGEKVLVLCQGHDPHGALWQVDAHQLVAISGGMGLGILVLQRR